MQAQLVYSQKTKISFESWNGYCGKGFYEIEALGDSVYIFNN